MAAAPTKDGQLRPGTYRVGQDIQAGTYRGEAGTGELDGCYWARLSSLDGSMDGIIANGFGKGQFFVAVQTTDVALETHCRIELVE